MKLLNMGLVLCSLIVGLLRVRVEGEKERWKRDDDYNARGRRGPRKMM